MASYIRGTGRGNGTKDNGDREPVPLRCEWFLWCENTTVRAVRHPLLGAVPTCERCEAEHVSLGGNPGFVLGLEDDE